MTKDELTEIITNIECISCSIALSLTSLDPKDVKDAVDEIWKAMNESISFARVKKAMGEFFTEIDKHA